MEDFSIYSEKSKTSSRNESISNEKSESLPDLKDVIKYGKLCDASKAVLSEYCEYSTVHGVRYLGERQRSWIERIFWIVVFAISIYICFYLINNIWLKWNLVPVIVSFAEKATPVWKVPLPTFTLCPDIKSRSEVFRFDQSVEELALFNMSHYHNWNETQKALFDSALQVCDFSRFQDYENVTNSFYKGSFKENLMAMAPLENLTFSYTMFQGEIVLGNGLFDRILTEKGVCYSFNLVDLHSIYRKKVLIDELGYEPMVKRQTKWTVEKGYEGENSNETFPYRSYSGLMQHGVTAVVNGVGKDIDTVCGEGDEGFKITVNTPGDVPQLSRHFFSVPFNYAVLINITPDLITTEEGAEDYSPKMRGCFYPHERYLKYFNTYSQSNCDFECLTNHTLRKCGCVRFNMPRFKGTPICGAGSIKCYKEAKRELLEIDFNRNSENHTLSGNPDCQCWPTCTSLTYNVGITQAPVHEKVKSTETLTTIKLYYKENRFWSSERSKLYGIIDFTANAGGLLGLFMGISVISVIEFGYFITLRLIGNLHLRCKARLKRISHIGVSMYSIADQKTH